MDDLRLAKLAHAATWAIVPAALVVSCRLTESLDGFTNGGGGTGNGGSGVTGGAGGQGTGGTGGPDGGGTGGTHTGGSGATHSGGTGGSPTGGSGGGDAAPDGPSNACASGACTGFCKDCDDNSTNGCETDTSSDKDHCGSCNHSCQGGACQGGDCQTLTLASSLTMPWGIVADEAYVYWVEEGSGNNGTVQSVPVTGGQKVELAHGQNAPVYLVADTDHLYWTTFASGGAIWRIRKDGSGQTQLSLATGPQGLAADIQDVWWTNASDASVRHVAKTGGSPQILSSQLNDPRGIAVDPVGGKVYWTSLAGGEILSASKTSGLKQTLVSGEDHPFAIAVDDQYVYWTDAGSYAAGDCSAADGKVVRAKKQDGTGRQELATGQACPLALWVDGGELYWTNTGTVTSGSYNYDGAVMRWNGSTVEAFESGQIRPYGITTNQSSVFWTEQGIFQSSGAVKKRAK